MHTHLVQLRMINVPRNIHFPYPVYSFGYNLSTPHCKARNHYFGKFEICIRLKSDEEYAEDYIDGHKYQAKFPHVIIKPPDVEHQYEIKGNRQGFYFIYPKSNIPLFKQSGISLSPYMWELVIEPEILDLINQLKALIYSSIKPGVPEKIDLLCYCLFQKLILNREQIHKKIYNDNEQKIRTIASYLQLHYNDDFKLDDIISQNGFSRRSFFRHWKEYFKHSPYQHVLELKMHEAEHLLTNSDLPVMDIAEQLNFNDTCYFIRMFRKYYNITPNQYRYQYRKNT